MGRLTLSSPAKINLHLSILSRRTDGYHDLLMLMEKINLCDEIILELGDQIGVTMMKDTTYSLVTQKEENLCYKAAKLLQTKSGIDKGVSIQLAKNIPIGGGLGGGSSNAATVLKGLNQLWELNWPMEKLAELGLQIGADVPFFLYEGPAIVEGVGEKVTPINWLPKFPLLLLNPGIHVSTPEAYQLWDKMALHKNRVSLPVTTLHNDFEAVIFAQHPPISEAKQCLLDHGATQAMMSGSGSTLFALFESFDARDQAFEQIRPKPGWRLFKAHN